MSFAQDREHVAGPVLPCPIDSLADRVVVKSEGRVSRVLVRGKDEFSEQALLLAMVEGSAAESDNPAVPRP
jgi:hypothetical protein